MMVSIVTIQVRPIVDVLFPFSTYRTFAKVDLPAFVFVLHVLLIKQVAEFLSREDIVPGHVCSGQDSDGLEDVIG